MNTYIDGKKFQFITDYSKHACKNTNGEDVILDFSNLSIYERIMLSSFLTILCDDKSSSVKRQNIYDKIFNFNSEKKYVKTSYHDSFLDDLSKFIKERPLFFSFIKDNFDTIVDNETVIFRSQLNSSEMELLYSLQFRRSYQSLMNVLYIIGVSKQNIQTTYLNKISLKSFYGSSSMAKNRVKEIFDKINKISEKDLKYKIDGGYVYFSSGFGVAQDEKFYSEEKKKFDKMKKEEEILNSFLQENKQINVTPKIEKVENVEVKKEIEKNEDEELIDYHSSVFPDDDVDALHLGDENLTKEMVLDYIELMHSKNIMFEPNEENTKIIRKFAKENAILQQLLPSTNKPSDICIVYHGDWIKGEDGLTRKKIAEENIKIIQRKILKSLSKLYDEDKKSYKVVLNYICKNFQNLFTNF